MLGRRAALLGSAVLLMSVGFLGCSRILLIDGLLALCTTVSLFAAYEAIRREKLHLGWWAAASVACGVAFLAKGPLALVLLVPPVFAFSWLTKGVVRPGWRHWLMLGGIVAVVVTPWFVLVSLDNPSFAYEFFYKHNVTRFAGAFHARPFWYFLPVLMIAGHPWTFLTVPYVGFMASHSEQSRRRRLRPIGYLLLWSLWCFTFFSLSSCKLPPYLLPAAPALALMIGSYLDQVLFSADKSRLLDYARKKVPWLATGMNGLVGIGFGVFVLNNGLEAPAVAWSLMAAWALLVAVALALLLRQMNTRAGWGAAVVSALLLSSLVFHRELPRYAQAQTIFGPGSPLIAQLNAKDPLVVATVAHEWSGIPFDLGRNDIHHFDNLESPELRKLAAEHPRILIVMRHRQDVTALQEQLPADALLTTIAVRGPARLVMVTASKRPTEVANTGRPNPSCTSRRRLKQSGSRPVTSPASSGTAHGKTKSRRGSPGGWGVVFSGEQRLGSVSASGPKPQARQGAQQQRARLGSHVVGLKMEWPFLQLLNRRPAVEADLGKDIEEAIDLERVIPTPRGGDLEDGDVPIGHAPIWLSREQLNIEIEAWS